MVIAENNDLNIIDQGMQYILLQEQIKLRKQGFRVEFPPTFRDKDSPSAGQSLGSPSQDMNPEQSSYCMQMGLKLFVGRVDCKKVQRSNENTMFFNSQPGIIFPEQTLQQLRIALKMQSGAYMFINRLGSYHQNLSLETFFNIKLMRVETSQQSEMQSV